MYSPLLWSEFPLVSHQKEIHSSDAGLLLLLGNSHAGLLLLLNMGYRELEDLFSTLGRDLPKETSYFHVCVCGETTARQVGTSHQARSQVSRGGPAYLAYS